MNVKRKSHAPQVGAPISGRKTTSILDFSGKQFGRQNSNIGKNWGAGSEKKKLPFHILKRQQDERNRQRMLLHRILTARFDEEELRNICFYMGVDYDSLRGEGKQAKARELILYLERQGDAGTQNLMQQITRQRPDLTLSHGQLKSISVTHSVRANGGSVQRVCYFNDAKYTLGSVVCCSKRLLECKYVSPTELKWAPIDKC